MRRLGNTVARLTAARRAMQAARPADTGRLGQMRDFGSNPGALVARTYVPADLADGAALVVVLHGCTQNAAVYDTGSSWSQLADRHGFALLFPEQRRANNGNLCFNWYDAADARRGGGEAESISQMVMAMTARHALDPARVFVTGLSAGGAMTAVMLATYPELFAGGAIIAGLPFASANSLPQALERMRGTGSPSRRDLAARAQQAADHPATPPRLSVWHGTQDTIVHPNNAVTIVDQWRDLHGLGTASSRVETVDGHRREIWSDSTGRDVIEKYDIRGMGHGTPLDARDGGGVAGPHMLDAGIDSTRRIADFWELTDASVRKHRPRPAAVVPTPPPIRPRPQATASAPGRPTPVGTIIEDALRAAGLMR